MTEVEIGRLAGSLGRGKCLANDTGLCDDSLGVQSKAENTSVLTVLNRVGSKIGDLTLNVRGRRRAWLMAGATRAGRMDAPLARSNGPLPLDP